MHTRLMIPFTADTPDAGLRHLLRRRAVAAVSLHGAALADAAACRALTAAIHSAAEELPPFVVLDAHDPQLPDDLRPPDPRHLALDLESGGEELEVTLKVMDWGRSLVELGVDLVLSPRLDSSQPPLSDPDVAARLGAAWTEALLAAGLVACAGPYASDCAWGPFGNALAHGLEAIHLDDHLGQEPSAARRSVEAVRDRASGLVVVGPSATDAAQARASIDAGVDLVRLAPSMATDEIESVLADLGDAGYEPGGAVDSLREDWLL